MTLILLTTDIFMYDWPNSLQTRPANLGSRRSRPQELANSSVQSHNHLRLAGHGKITNSLNSQMMIGRPQLADWPIPEPLVVTNILLLLLYNKT